MPRSLLLAGAGKMGLAMLHGWLANGLAPSAVTVIDPRPSDDLRALASEGGIRLNPKSGSAPDVAVLAIKPQSLPEAADGLAPFIGTDTLLVSILAGTTVAGLRAVFPAARAVVRAMPNLPAAIGRGATGVYPDGAVTDADRAAAEMLLGANGIVEWVGREGDIDAVTAVSGSGPAYVFHLVEALAAAGEAAGLEPGLAGRLARQTVIGSGALLDDSLLPASQLRENVTSKGGTTAAALSVLAGPGGFGPLLREAVAAAKRRAEELAAPSEVSVGPEAS